jgi:1,4-alpha-glucan branching enzyme
MATPKKPAVKSKTAAKPKAAPKVVSKPTKAAAVKPTGTSKTVSPATEFSLYAPEAGEVLLAGNFCDWQGEKCRMRRGRDGSWKKSLKLKPGRYEYRFVVDGHWWTDPTNPQREQNPYGQENSVLTVA